MSSPAVSLSDYFPSLCVVGMGTRRCETGGSPVGRLFLSRVGGGGERERVFRSTLSRPNGP